MHSTGSTLQIRTPVDVMCLLGILSSGLKDRPHAKTFVCVTLHEHLKPEAGSGFGGGKKTTFVRSNYD